MITNKANNFIKLSDMLDYHLSSKELIIGLLKKYLPDEVKLSIILLTKKLLGDSLQDPPPILDSSIYNESITIIEPYLDLRHVLKDVECYSLGLDYYNGLPLPYIFSVTLSKTPSASALENPSWLYLYRLITYKNFFIGNSKVNSKIILYIDRINKEKDYIEVSVLINSISKYINNIYKHNQLYRLACNKKRSTISIKQALDLDPNTTIEILREYSSRKILPRAIKGREFDRYKTLIID